jgi:hypothetical protein
MDQLRDDDILLGAEIGEEVVELIDEAQRIAAEAGAPVIVEPGGFLALDRDRAFEAAFEQPDRLEQGRLSRARRARAGRRFPRRPTSRSTPRSTSIVTNRPA